RLFSWPPSRFADASPCREAVQRGLRPGVALRGRPWPGGGLGRGRGRTMGAPAPGAEPPRHPAMPRVAATFLANAHARLVLLDEALARAAEPADVAWTLCGFAGKELELVDAIVYLCDAGGRTLTQQAAWGPKRAASRVLES